MSEREWKTMLCEDSEEEGDADADAHADAEAEEDNVGFNVGAWPAASKPAVAMFASLGVRFRSLLGAAAARLTRACVCFFFFFSFPSWSSLFS